MNKELPKVYDPRDVEKKIYKLWMDGGYFKGVIDPGKKPFTIVIPPPNVTGQLHLGHAFDETLQDVLVRHKRMQGYAALWVPGTDHAGIATQIKVEEQLRKEGLTRYDLGREKFVERVWDWKNKYGSRIVEQLKTLGSSCDWSRERFTMDEGCSRAVREVFVSLYEKGLIYKGNRIINWCPKCTTALSDAEVEHAEQAGHFWHIKYPVKGSDEYVVVATTRPETMLGDTGVAVHPDDERYKHLVGKTVVLPLMNREIPVVADEYVDREFGTGCVKMTPCHDPNDFEVGLRHNLEQILVLDENARIQNGGKYNGLDRYEARKQIVKDLEELGLLVKVEEHTHSVGECYRCGTTVEPMTSPQWFVKMQPLAEDALRVVEDGTIQFVPDRFVKIYNNWMTNAHDWCISRQLWWGHQIPAWYCADCGHVTVSRQDPAACEHCHGKSITRDEDVLDTWFSSALWPFSTLGWPDKTPDLEYFYPTSVLVTGYDIIFFWVARMIFSGMEHMKKEPFKTVLFHGLIRDAQGRKMSKSLGNGVDPIEVIDTYGADALRFNIITGNSPGNDMRFYPERCEAMRNFANKIWNASRFVMMNLTVDKNALPDKLELEDKWIVSKLNTLVREVNENMDKFELGIAASKIYDFIWDSYCDWYIELTKPRLNGDDAAARVGAQQVLLYVLIETLKLLHPFMPFITEEIWQALPHEGAALMVEKYPEYSEKLAFPEDEANFEMIMAAVRTIRQRRSEMNVPPSKRPHLIIAADKTAVFETGRVYLSKLAFAGELTIGSVPPPSTDGMVTVVTNDAKLYMPLNELVDLDKERERIQKELKKAQDDLGRTEAKLQNESFVSKAPENVVNAERERVEKLKALLGNLQESLKALG
ncbi:valyl-tRNA synthetase [Sporobacter termitidis DSM 10068]|uniref:Valine--tRNA ligase n=1 Tax=Sporobacter termitidis DSM 10068 TaxID=1123282 RepID=A0A1M5VK34_9FIRM|nr:valine--tRNA ligase [Sporobacter termitidis]SHH75567.1 valyl-tRNA synthetase [Sporobacter termitidis DSM 10068]